ncbi:MAG: streptomycin 6-kinase [Acidobacteriota bacterium]|jgi:streptomycin 6-kinase|nr:streptomycin 6-kinase [Acidobacteriota bacterium]
MESAGSRELRRRVEERISAWRIVVERMAETESSILAFGRRDDQPVVLKVIRNRGDEWRSGEILDAFAGQGVVRVYDYVEGAMLLERLNPGKSLADIALNGDDNRATEILAEVIGKMSPRGPVSTVATIQEWVKGFERHAASGNNQISKRLVLEAHRVYSELCVSQSRPRLLHGDLHHYNVLLDSERGWLAIDPKGVVGELEYEVGAALRNPYERPELFAEPAVIRKRVERFARELKLDAIRTLAWGFAQAVLSAIWAVEDGAAVETGNPWIALANAIRPMLDDVGGRG